MLISPPMYMDDVSPEEFSGNDRSMTILHLCDKEHPGNVVQDHISAFAKFSRHKIVEINPRTTKLGCLDPGCFDIILIHYSIYILGEDYIPSEFTDFVYRFPGPKIQIIQDECRNICHMTARIRKLGIDILFSSLTPENIDRIYAEIKGLVAYATIPGVMTERLMKMKVAPIAERRLDVAYRAYDMPYELGNHGQIKSLLAAKFPALAEKYDLKVNISGRNEDRIYGDDWPKFIASAKTVLGSEGGSSIFDFTGIKNAVEIYRRLNPRASYEDVFEKILKPFEGNILHKTITPRIFESIALRTAMVLVPGEYRGVLKPWKHYVPLKADFSNIEEVAEAIRDATLLQNMVDRNFREIACAPQYTWPHFIGQFDLAVDRALDLLEQSTIIWRHPYKRQKQKGFAKFRGLDDKLSSQLILARPRVLLLCNIQTNSALCCNDHIFALRDYSQYHIDVVSILANLPSELEVKQYDIIIFHWTLVLCYNNYICPKARAKLARAPAFKVAFIQDEYRFVDQTSAALRVLGVKLLFTVVPEGQIEKVYPTEKIPGLTKVNVLTGYVPFGLVNFPVPGYGDRTVDVSYRGRSIPAWFGALAQEKANIGKRFQADAKAYGLNTDIAWKETDRIYHDEWLMFMANSKATLGVESGASVFDFTGEIQRLVEEHVATDPTVTFEELSKLYFAEEEGKIILNQISPRAFEASALRTLMVLYEGRYSDIIKPWRHFVPLKKDHSNMDEVVTIIRDERRATEITEAAYHEIACDPQYTYKAFVKYVDDYITKHYHLHCGLKHTNETDC